MFKLISNQRDRNWNNRIKTKEKQTSGAAVRIQEDPAATAEAQAGAVVLENNSGYLVGLRQL